MYDVAIIGAGIIGTFIFRELSRYDLKVVLIEKDSDIADGATKANSAIVHAGYDAVPGTLKAKFNALGNPMFDKVCEELDVHFKRIGSLVIATNEEEMEVVKELYERGIKNGIPNMKILNKEEVREMEENLNEDVLGALYAPTAGIVSPWELAVALAENAVDNGADIKLESEVTDIKRTSEGYCIYMGKEILNTKYIINCAGIYADKINEMVASKTFEIRPRRGQYNVLDKSVGNLVKHVIFQAPTKLGKGVLVTPTVHGNLLVGPDAEDIEDREDTSTTSERIAYVRQTARKSVKDIPFNLTITSFAGLRAKSSTGDFIIEESKEAKGFINVAGIDSPGLSSAPAIAEYVVDIVKDIAGGLKEKENFNPRRRPVIRFMELSDDEKAELIKKDPRYGRIICRCESITEGEIVDAIHRNAGARTVDGVKRRVRPGMGRCQGGFCGPRVMEILARELGKDIKEIVKDGKSSYILVGETKKADKVIEEVKENKLA
ncbi:glycerol-3-phosphate dehydrogenase [Caminicella sporogenes DSM 14501]|uniref:Glycerol-3-phosphate dehydrogenase n=1 Tax=Caminicella sporogenes DSM 14501 TaxID=1121266 RepID=A0A1M6Q6M2_9FIRM|nr:NAD(P)/FAD-dependent oxidoreductase [Caminicella sporogenes]RKD23592.1 FAD/NAD(P)-binding oxidoreductase [Caminicella sporogenes]SHK15780.1 glycerol-3-phosphate dehydrogenase [Caminicella sporogenes DSM 14501]